MHLALCARVFLVLENECPCPPERHQELSGCLVLSAGSDAGFPRFVDSLSEFRLVAEKSDKGIVHGVQIGDVPPVLREQTLDFLLLQSLSENRGKSLCDLCPVRTVVG